MTTDPRTLLTDAGYVAVGLGVIVFQKAQVARRDLEQQLAGGAGQLSETVEDVRKLVEERVGALSVQLPRSVEELKARIPDQAFEAFDTALGAAKDATGQLLDLVRPNAA